MKKNQSIINNNESDLTTFHGQIMKHRNYKYEERACREMIIVDCP